MAVDVGDLPSAVEGRDDLSPRERDVLSLIGQGMASREIAQHLALSESTVYRVIADLLEAVELEPPTFTAADIHGRARTRPATADEVAGFHSELGPFDTDAEADACRGQPARGELTPASTSRRSPTTSPA